MLWSFNNACCVFWLTFGCYVHPKAGWNFLPAFKIFLFFSDEKIRKRLKKDCVSGSSLVLVDTGSLKNQKIKNEGPAKGVHQLLGANSFMESLKIFFIIFFFSDKEWIKTFKKNKNYLKRAKKYFAQLSDVHTDTAHISWSKYTASANTCQYFQNTYADLHMVEKD